MMQGNGMQTMGQNQPAGQPMAMQPMGPPAVPNAYQGGQIPLGMAPNPYQYGAPQTAMYVQQQNQQQAQQRMPNQF